MGKNWKRVAACSMMLVAASMVPSARAWESSYAKNGVYLNLSYVYNNMSGDFDDTSYYSTSTTVYDVPDVKDGDGFYVALGGRSNTLSYELGYQRTVHDTSSSFVGIGDSTATYHVVDMNMRFDVLARQQIRPYLLVGVGFTWIDIDDSATDGFTYDDETFSGFALNAGAGIAYYMQPQWALTAGIVHRWNWYDRVESKDLNDDLKEQALGFTAGMAYTF